MEISTQKNKLEGYTLIRTIRKNLFSVRGYTLIEILVALTIIGLLFGVGYAGFRDFSRRQAIADAAKEIQGDLRLAQGEAITGKKPEGCSDTKTLSGYGFRADTSKYSIEANCGGSVIIIKNVDLPPDITLLTPTPNPLLFKVLGQGTNLGSDVNWTLTLTQTGTGNTVTVTVTAGGEVK